MIPFKPLFLPTSDSVHFQECFVCIASSNPSNKLTKAVSCCSQITAEGAEAQRGSRSRLIPRLWPRDPGVNP